MPFWPRIFPRLTHKTFATDISGYGYTRSQFHQLFMRAFFVRKCFTQLFSSSFWLHIFWQKDVGKKSASKMLMKLTTYRWLHESFLQKCHHKKMQKVFSILFYCQVTEIKPLFFFPTLDWMNKKYITTSRLYRNVWL